MMAGADEPATLSGFCQPMAIAMVWELKTSIQDEQYGRTRRKRRRKESRIGGLVGSVGDLGWKWTRELGWREVLDLEKKW
jgi:hypothetical protein